MPCRCSVRGGDLWALVARVSQRPDVEEKPSKTLLKCSKALFDLGPSPAKRWGHELSWPVPDDSQVGRCADAQYSLPQDLHA